jgi:hypothetical protein
MNRRRRLVATAATGSAAILVTVAALFVGIAGAAPRHATQTSANPEVESAVHQDVSPALAGIAPQRQSSGVQRDRPLRLLPVPHGANAQPDGAVQTSAGPTVSTTAVLTFPGIGDTSNTPSNPCNCAPPDTNGAVGATQYVQWVNSAFAVYNKSTGAPVYGPAAGNTLWKGFGGGCELNNDGDPVVQYDKAAGRWVMSQFSVTTTPYLQCVAVSTTSDATGTWNRYAFQQPNFDDYPKLSVWPDGYYDTFNMFNGNTFVGGRVCAFDRASMLTGAAATQVCFQLSSSFGGLLASDLDGTTAPPAGEPNYVMNFGTNTLNVWTFHVDFATPANSTLTGPTSVPVAAFTAACNGGGTCIPQAGTRNQLDSLADRLMFRLAYRNFGSYAAMVVNHSVTVGSGKKGTSTGIRWYELHVTGGAVSVFQQGTFAPDATSRWMGSIAMDKLGDMALGYSASSSSLFPGLRYTGRVPSDPAGTMEAENTVLTGSGSQTGNLHRWGDYSDMTVDPSNDCTFWYTNEYIASTGSFNWSTEITAFKFPSCV